MKKLYALEIHVNFQDITANHAYILNCLSTSSSDCHLIWNSVKERVLCLVLQLIEMLALSFCICFVLFFKIFFAYFLFSMCRSLRKLLESRYWPVEIQQKGDSGKIILLNTMLTLES